MEEIIKEIKQREEEYRLQLENMKIKSIEETKQLKETIRSFQEKERQHREQFQLTSGYSQGKLERKEVNKQARPNDLKQVNQQGKQSMQQQQKSRSSYERLKQYYPQVQSQRSIFNPFK